MKNYALDREESKNFIMNYQRKGDALEIHYGSGESELVVYTPEEEKKLLERMRKQVLDSSETEKYHEKRCKKLEKLKLTSKILIILGWAVLSGVMLSGVVLSGIFAEILCLETLPCWIGILCIDILGVDVIISLKKEDSVEVLADIKKYKLFLENEEKLNEKIKENERLLLGILIEIFEDAKEIIEENKANIENNPVFTLNSIDEMSYEEINQILDTIGKREQEFSDSIEEKPIEYVKE